LTALAAALAYLFSFYERGYRQRAGLLDSQVREPTILAAVVHQLGYLPEKSKTIVVTGSKGKGSTARMIAWHLQQAGFRVGLVVSPEELSHLDRLRINNSPITPERFVQLVQVLAPAIDQTATQGTSHYYHSPSDLFMVLGLAWFKQEKVDYVVLEGGRGAQFDLIGQIPARIGVVTSVFLEHAAFLGSNEPAIARDKFSLTRNCDQVLAPCSVAQWIPAIHDANLKWVDFPIASQTNVVEPRWLAQARHLAATVATALGVAPARAWDSPSFARYQLNNTTWILDGAISPAALDERFLAHLVAASAKQKTAVILGLTRDKAPQAVSAGLAAAGLTAQYQIELRSGSVGLSDSNLVLTPIGQLDLQIGFDSTTVNSLRAFGDQFDQIYCIGVQLFLRSVRTALDCHTLVGPRSSI
jgi:Mur ligase middle domain